MNFESKGNGERGGGRGRGRGGGRGGGGGKSKVGSKFHGGKGGKGSGRGIKDFSKKFTKDTDIHMSYFPKSNPVSLNFRVSGFSSKPDPSNFILFLKDQGISNQPEQFEFDGNNQLFVKWGDGTDAINFSKLHHLNYLGQKLYIKSMNEQGESPIRGRGRGKGNRGRGKRFGGDGGGSGFNYNQKSDDQLLSDIVSSKFQPVSGLLDLSRVSVPNPRSDEFHTTPTETVPQVHLGRTKTLQSLVRVIIKNCPSIQSLDLSHNYISTLSGLGELKKLEGLKNLSLESNAISEFKEIDHLKGLKLNQLILHDNPLKSKNEIKSYRDEIGMRIRDLKMLDGEEMSVPVINFGIPTRSLELPQSQPDYFDTEDTKKIAVSFLRKYFENFDSGRDALNSIYVQESFFSLSISSIDKKTRDLNEYFRFNRNLSFITDPDKRQKLIFHGRDDIIKQFKLLPQTKHEIQSFQVDSFLLQRLPVTILMIDVNGSFVSQSKRRTFNRTFLLTPTTHGSIESQQGWPGLVLNDLLHIQKYLPNGKSTTTTTTTTTTTSTASPSSGIPMALPPAMQSLLPQQQSLIIEFCKASRMNPQFSFECLSQNGWDSDKAWNDFIRLNEANQIPPSAFMN